MPKKKIIAEKVVSKKREKEPQDEEAAVGEESAIDPAIIEDTFAEEFSEYNDVDNF